MTALTNVFLNEVPDPDELYVVLFNPEKTGHAHWTNDDNVIRNIQDARKQVTKLESRAPFYNYAIGKLQIINGLFEVVELIK